MIPFPFNQLPNNVRQPITVNRNATIFRQRDKTQGFYLIMEGGVKLVRHSAIGEEIIIHRALMGNTFAEASLFSSTYHCDAIAECDTSLLKFDKSITLQFMKKNPSFAMDLTARLAHDIQRTRRYIELLSIRSARKRVLIAIEEGWLKGDIKNLASQINLSHEATYRALAELVKTGSIVKNGHGKYSPIAPQKNARRI